MVEATAETGTYDVFVIANATNPNIQDRESNRQSVRITSGDIYWENPEQTVAGDFYQQDDPETKLEFTQPFSSASNSGQGGDQQRDQTQDTRITSFDDISQWDTEQKPFIIPNEKQEDKEFFIQSGQENPKTCTGQFDVDNECYFEAIINATGEPDQAFEIFFIGNSTNPNVDTQISNTKTVGIGEPTNIQGKAVVDGFEDWNVMPDMDMTFNTQLDLVPDFTQEIGVTNVHEAFQIYGFEPTQRILQVSFDPFGREEQSEKFIIPNEYSEGDDFFIESGQPNPKSCNQQFEPGDECYYEALINASGEPNQEFEVFFIGNSTNPNVDTVHSNTQNVGIGEPTNLQAEVILDGFENHIMKNPIGLKIVDRVDLVPNPTQQIGVTNIHTAFQVYGFEPTQNILPTSFEPFGQDDQREKFIIPTERGATPFFVESGPQPESQTGILEPGEGFHYSAEINATGEEQTQYEVFLLGNSTNPNVETVHSNTQNVGIGEPTNPGATILLDSLEDPLNSPVMTQITGDQLDLFRLQQQDLIQGFEMTAGTILQRDAIQPFNLVQWEALPEDEEDEIHDKGFILPTQPDEDYPFFVQDGPQPQTHTEQIEPGWTTSYTHLVNTTGEPGNYEVYHYANASNPNVEENISNNVTVQIREEGNVGVYIFRGQGFFATQQIGINQDILDQVILETQEKIEIHTGMELEWEWVRQELNIQQVGISSNIPTEIEIFDNIQEAISITNLGQDVWKVPETGLQIIETGTQLDTHLIAENLEILPVIGDFFQDDNVSPTIHSVDLQIEELGHANQVNLVVNATDPDGQSDLEQIKFQDQVQELDLQPDEQTFNFNLGDQLEGDDTVIIEDSAGHNDTYNIAYNITDNDWVQETEEITLDHQEITKEDTLENTGDREFEYEVTHSVFGDRTQTQHHRGNITGTLQPQETDTLNTHIEGNYLEQDFNDWTQDHRMTSTDETQFISKRLSIDNLPSTTWENIETPSVENPDSFDDCDSCSESEIDQFSGDYNDDHYWQDTGNAINREMTGTLEDYEIGERDSYFEQFRYTDIEETVNFTEIHVTEQIDDSETETGGYMTVADYNMSWNQGLLEPVETPECTIGDEEPEWSSADYNNETWKGCSQDLTGNERPDTFKAVIPSFTNTTEHNIRFGGFIGLEEDEEDQPFPGLREQCEDGETFGGLECVGNQWRTESQTTRSFSIADQDATEIGEGLGIMIAIMSTLLYATWATRKRRR